MSDSVPTTDCDVLIIGGGLAACMAALEASKRNMDVVLVDKGRLGRSGSSPTSGGVPQAAFAHADPRDSKDQHFRDTILGGDYIPNQKIVRAIVDEVTDRVVELEEMGLHFKKTPDGKQFYQEKRLGSSYARSCPPVGGSVGMLGSLRKEVFNREVQVHQWTMVTKLLRQNGRVTGAFGINVQKGTYHAYRARAVVLAGGSAIGIQKYTSANFLTTGDAYVAAFDIGAPLANLEFLEFTLIPAPGGEAISMAGLSPFTSKGGRFFNALNERFLEKYDPERLEGTTRAILVGATYKEMLEGRGPVCLDPSYIPDEKWDDEIQFEYTPKLGKAGINPRSDRFQWVPALHTFLGGLDINERCEVNGVEGLYASGESGHRHPRLQPAQRQRHRQRLRAGRAVGEVRGHLRGRTRRWERWTRPRLPPRSRGSNPSGATTASIQPSFTRRSRTSPGRAPASCATSAGSPPDWNASGNSATRRSPS